MPQDEVVLTDEGATEADFVVVRNYRDLLTVSPDGEWLVIRMLRAWLRYMLDEMEKADANIGERARSGDGLVSRR